MAAYAFARIQFPGSGGILWVLLLSMAFPEIGTIVPLYRILAGLRLLDTISGLTLVLSSVLTRFTVWVLVAFIKQVPYEIEEAATSWLYRDSLYVYSQNGIKPDSFSPCPLASTAVNCGIPDRRLLVTLAGNQPTDHVAARLQHA